MACFSGPAMGYYSAPQTWIREGSREGDKEMRKGIEKEITHYCETLPTLLIASDAFRKRLTFQCT